MNRSLFYAAGLLMLAACSQSPKQNYVVTLNADDSYNGKMAYIVDFDTDDTLDSAMIENGVVVFEGTVAAPRYAALRVDD
ncbi:MAG: DUF4369 domain-containing protein, partial [Duncaniella sp.]|nr:DUF4369 domain-containing protein [Duncaniella sp.]